MDASSHKFAPKVKPISSAHVPLAAIAIVTSHSRPRRSATMPPHTHPAPPMAIARNATSAASWSRLVPAGIPAAAALIPTNVGIHVQAL